ncbi:MAG: shikimate dehydrogenase [Lachnospiraceae bacterium]|nr:shikimate dehydrogenase [Lachnospiraceae bacterium]
METSNQIVINGKTRLCGVIGNPVEHTLSPDIHNTLANACGINLAYAPFFVEKGGLEAAIKGAFALNVLGINVTVPYKQDVIAHLEDIDPLAKAVESVNTLVRTGNGYKGYNTDMSGLYRAMLDDDVVLENEQVILLGAGGVGRAVAYLCAAKGAAHVWLLNRSADKAEQIAKEVNAKCGRECVTAMGLDGWKELSGQKYLAIQATSVGLHPDSDRAIVEDRAFYQMLHTGYDLIYKPAETKFMKLCKAAGANAYNGLKMLVFQGVEAFELWNNVTVSKEQAMRIYEMLSQKTAV